VLNCCTYTFENARRAQCHFLLHNYQENRDTNEKRGGHKSEFYSSHKLQPSFAAILFYNKHFASHLVLINER
jgi:hypothetical protein